MVDMQSAVISSTVYDLPEHRKAAEDACLRQSFFPRMMEHQAPSPADSLHLSWELVDQADVYVLILGFRYGELAAGQDKSFTHLELDRANERGIPKLALLMSDEHPLKKADVDTGLGAERVNELREQVRRQQAVNFFTSAEHLKALLIDGLSNLRKELQPREVSFHHVGQIVAPPEPYIAHPYTLLQTSEVVGRQQELNVLTDWVTGSGVQFSTARVMTFVAIGGIGKSAVTWKWFNEIAPHEMRPLAGRLWWSFYESDARFDNFVARTLAYVSGRTLDQVKEMRAAEREEELLAALDQKPYLIVLDGLERLLLAYARPDAAYLADDDLDTRTANTVANAWGLPPSAAVSFTGQSRLRITADPRAGAFLRRLTTVRASRVLATSRLYPADLQTVTGTSIQGAAAYFVKGLGDDDAVNLWRAFDVTGGRGQLVALFNTFDNYPLLIRALAGEVARFRPAPGDFDAWQQAHSEFDPYGLPLVQRKSHVLQFALSGLTDAEKRVLYTIAAFRGPATYEALAALLVGSGKSCPDEAAIDVVLSDLEDRGLVGWDRRGNRYDLHPVVRGVAWSALDRGAKQDIYQNLAAHFEALPRKDEDEIKTIDDLTGAIELYHTLVRLHRAEEAWEILGDRILDFSDRTGSYREIAEIIELFVKEPGLLEVLKEKDEEDAGGLLASLGLFYYLSGDPGRALDAFNTTSEAFVEENRYALLFFTSMALSQMGNLADAERSARESMNIDVEEEGIGEGFSFLALATVLIRRGKYEEGVAWLSDYRLEDDDETDQFFGPLKLLELGMATLQLGDITRAQDFAMQIAARVEGLGRPVPRIQALAFGARMSEALGERERAQEMLNDALVLAREMRLADGEAGLLIQLGGWNARDNHLSAARRFAADALQVAEHGQLRLRQVDAINLLSSIERACGNQGEAASRAAQAYRLAWCDGPPFSYEQGIRQARENLAAAEEPEPEGLPPFDPSTQMPELTTVPISPIEALSLQPPLNDNVLTQIIRKLPKGNDSAAALRTLYGSAASSPESRAAAVGELMRVDEKFDRVWRDLLRAAEDTAASVRFAAIRLIATGRHPDAQAVLTRLLNTEHDPQVRQLLGGLLSGGEHFDRE
jgi:tetratricopeptide (TPR) repeat protein